MLDYYDAWSSIQMIITDTTAVNTGHKNGVVKKIQTEMLKNGLLEPQYIGCQHHILDRILMHILDFFIKTVSRNPCVNYDFVDEVLQKYAVLKLEYSGDVPLKQQENPGWRDDFQFLFELCEGYRIYRNLKKLPMIKWRQLPSLHAARWNSRAIYSLIAYFLLPDWRNRLEVVNNFIANEWQASWFSGQMNNNELTTRLSIAIENLKCPPAMKCFKTHWSFQESRIAVPRTNIIAERGVKLMTELKGTCKHDKYLNLKFVATNSL